LQATSFYFNNNRFLGEMGNIDTTTKMEKKHYKYSGSFLAELCLQITVNPSPETRGNRIKTRRLTWSTFLENHMFV
jgi:hypothetical protein